MSIIQDKIEVIDQAFSSFGARSFADLGGVWGVEGAYTFHALEKYEVRDAVLVDTRISETVSTRGKDHPRLRLINGNFGSQATVDQIGRVDAVFLFDVLLHQVGPDWDGILEMYAKNVQLFVIYNQQWKGSDSTVRLLDLGEKEYFRNVPADTKQEPYKDLFKKLDDKHPHTDTTWRDVHSIWQWGITDDDLEATAARLGFKLVYEKFGGQWDGLDNFENKAFIFSR